MNPPKYKEGDEVILHEHEHIPTRGKNWCDAMNQYIGSKTKITKVHQSPDTGWVHYRVDVDGGQWSWREESVTLVSSRNTQDDGAQCSKCRDFIPYASKSSNFVCYSCRNRH